MIFSLRQELFADTTAEREFIRLFRTEHVRGRKKVKEMSKIPWYLSKELSSNLVTIGPYIISVPFNCSLSAENANFQVSFINIHHVAVNKQPPF